jgi:hypothetical protein
MGHQQRQKPNLAQSCYSSEIQLLPLAPGAVPHESDVRFFGT